MPKQIEFEIVPRPGYHSPDVRIVMTVKPWGRPVRSRKQFTVDLDDLKRALKRAEILEEKRVLVEKVEDGSKLLAEIAWYTYLVGQTGGTPSATKQRNILWARITKALNLT